MDTEHKENQLLFPTDPQQRTKMSNLQPEVIIAPLNHVCDICHKAFQSGQALGGHKSMHFREAGQGLNPSATSTSSSTSEGVFGCLICAKNFPSKKSLYGHMRSHSANLSPHNSTSSATSTVSDMPADDNERHASITGLYQTKSNWPPTKKRRKRGSDISSVTCDSMDLEKFSALLVLADECAKEAQKRALHVDFKNCVELLVRYDEIGPKKKRLNNEHGKTRPAADHDGQYGYIHDDINRDQFICKLCSLTFTSYQDLGGHMSKHSPIQAVPLQCARAYRCTICYKEFGSPQALGGHKSSSHNSHIKNTSNSADVVNKDVNVAETDHKVEMYNCHVCNKAFTSHQALGGHVSSHSKLKIINNNVARDQSSLAVISAGSADQYSNERQRLHETVPHACTICNKIFPTGQALGGHKRLHWNSPTEAQAQARPIPQSSAPRKFEINLNELPAMEDDDGVYVPIRSVDH